MSELTENLRKEFQDHETRHIYAEDFLNTYIATQIKVLREQAGWTQSELAERAGMKQERISVLEDVNYSSWTATVLKRLAKAFEMRLSIKIESFGSFLDDFEHFSRESLLRPSFEYDPAFQETKVTATEAAVLKALGGEVRLASSDQPKMSRWLSERHQGLRQVLESSTLHQGPREGSSGNVIDMMAWKESRPRQAALASQEGGTERGLLSLEKPTSERGMTYGTSFR